MKSAKPCIPRLFILILGLFVVVTGSADPSVGEIFIETTIDTGFRVGQPLLAGNLAGETNNELVLVGQDDDFEQRLAVYRLDDSSKPEFVVVTSITVEPEWVYFDVGRLGEQDYLFFLAPGRILRYEFKRGQSVEFVEVQSIYRHDRTADLQHLDFIRDINADERDDLIVPDLDGLRVRLQSANGELGDEMLLPDGVRMELNEDSARYDSRPDYTADMNFDGRADLVVRRDREFRVYLQNGGQGFDGEALVIPIELDLPSEARIRQLNDPRAAVDQSELTVKRIYWIEDLNGDGLLDIITDATHSEGVFDKRNEFGVHLARRDGETITFDRVEDSLLSSKGLQFDLISTDINGDSQQDLVIPSVRLSFGRVVAALFSGSVSLDLRFYKMHEDGSYTDEANYQSRAKVRFDLTSGHVDVPAIEVDDFDGDGFKDLLVQTDRDRLAIFPGEDTEQLFASKPFDVRTTLPRNGELVDAMDINDDEKSDLVIRYNASDGEDQDHTVRLMLAR